jgi:hypothetical protein
MTISLVEGLKAPFGEIKMKRRALPIILTALAITLTSLAITGPGKLEAQVITAPDSVIFLSPFGPWALCLSPDPSTVALATGAGFCDAPPADTYLLLYKGPPSNATWFQYKITAIVAESTSPITVTGVWRRNDNASGWSNTQVNIPGLVTSFTVDISGLTPVPPRLTTMPLALTNTTATTDARR